jgi:hypothetical protein
MGGDKCGAGGHVGWVLGKQHRHARSLAEIPADGDESHNNRLGLSGSNSDEGHQTCRGAQPSHHHK